DVCEVLRLMQSHRENYLTDGVSSNGEHPSCYEHDEMPETRTTEAVLETDLVNLERLWQIPLGHRRSSPVCFQTVYGRNADHFQMIPVKYPGLELKRAKL